MSGQLFKHLQDLREAAQGSKKTASALEAIDALDATTAKLALTVARGALDSTTTLTVDPGTRVRPEGVRHLGPLENQSQLECLEVRFSDPRPDWPNRDSRGVGRGPWTNESTPVDLSALATLPNLRRLSIIAESVDATPIMLLDKLEHLQFSGDPDSGRSKIVPAPPRNTINGRANVLAYRRKIVRHLLARDNRTKAEEAWLTRGRALGLLGRAAPKPGASTRKLLASLRKLMKSRAPDQLVAAQELIMSLGPGPATDVVVEGCSVDPEGKVIAGPEVLRRIATRQRRWFALAALHAAGRMGEVGRLDLACEDLLNLRPLAGATALQHLNLSGGATVAGAHLTTEGLAILARLDSLRTLDLSWTLPKETATQLGLIGPPGVPAMPVFGRAIFCKEPTDESPFFLGSALPLDDLLDRIQTLTD